MLNPAQRLQTILTTWRDSQDHTATADSRRDPDLVIHRRAVACIADIERMLPLLDHAGKRTDFYRKRIPTWSRIVFNFPRNWREHDRIDERDIEDLDPLIDALAPYVPDFDTTRVSKLEAYLKEVLSCIDDSDLSAAQKGTMRATIIHLQGLLDDLSVVGTFDFELALNRLFTQLATAAAMSQSEAWQNLFTRFFREFIWSTGVNTGTSVLLTGVHKALTM